MMVSSTSVAGRSTRLYLVRRTGPRPIDNSLKIFSEPGWMT